MAKLSDDAYQMILEFSTIIERRLVEAAWSIADEHAADSVERDHVEIAIQQLLQDTQGLHDETHLLMRRKNVRLRAG